MKKKLSMAKPGGTVTTSGYLPDSPDRFNAFNIIPSGNITMDSVPHDVLGIADTGQTKLMKSNSGLHRFTGAKSVTEVPMYTIGGKIPDQLPRQLQFYQMQEGGPAPDTSSSDKYYSANATLSYFKNILNDKLKEKNPQAFTNYFAGLKQARMTNNHPDDYIQNTPYEEYLSPDEVKGTLGENYKKYIQSLQDVNNYNVLNGKQTLYGNKEGNNDVTMLNYGRRFASLQVTPRFSLHQASDTGTSKDYSRQYTYNPQTGSVDITEGGDLTIMPNTFTHPGVTNATQTVSRQFGGGVMAGNYQLPWAQDGATAFTWSNLSDGTTPAAPQTNPAFKIDQTPGSPTSPYPVVPIEKGSKPGQWNTQKQVSWGPNVEGASAFVGALGAVANTLNRKTNSALYNNQINRSTSDSQFQTYNPTLSRGYIDPNSGMTAPDKQVLTQSSNLPYQSFYGQPPIAQLGTELPNMTGPQTPLNGINAHVDNGMFPPSMGFSPVSAPVQAMQPTPEAPSPQGQLSTDGYQSVKDFIKKQEGFAKKAAWDHKQFTNGYGTEAKAPDEIISRQEADKRLDNYLLPTVQKIQSKLQVPINNGQLTALSSMAYNGGYGVVRKLINQINKGAGPDQVAELIKKTAITVDNGARVLDDLVARRKKEAGLYTRGYKVGGQYDLGQQEIQDLMNQGYELEFM